MNLVSRLRRRRRSKNTRTESGLVLGLIFFVASGIIIATLILYYCQNPDSNYTDYRFSNMEPSTYPSDHMTHLLIQF